jgi:cleavage and polyadenylation specificity factor subunit 1
LNGWASRISDLSYPPITGVNGALPGETGEEDGKLMLEGSRALMISDKTLFLILKSGTIYPIELHADGKTVSKLSIAAPLAQTTIPSVVRMVGEECFFVGSTVGVSCLLKAAWVEVLDDEGGEGGVGGGGGMDVMGREDVDMDDDDDGMYTLSSLRRSLFLIMTRNRHLWPLQNRHRTKRYHCRWCYHGTSEKDEKGY